MKKNLKIHLLIIDPQNDFCDLPTSYLPSDPLKPGEFVRPKVPVRGAHEDMLRLSHFIRSAQEKLSSITVSLDSHHRVGIERPAMWIRGNGSDVQPFTAIRAMDVRTGAILPRNPAHASVVLDYLDALERGGKYVHMVWPAHCEVGSWGHNVHPAVQAACSRWEECHLRVVSKVFKGLNPWTEHYSAILAEVPDQDDMSTMLNSELLDSLFKADLVLIAGEAGSHCVKATTEHIVEHIGSRNPARFVLLQDCISPVRGYEAQYQTFLVSMLGLGVQVRTSQSVLAELSTL